MKKIIMSVVIGVGIGFGLFALVLMIRQNSMVSKYIDVKNNYGKIEQYETIMDQNKSYLNNYNSESSAASINCINSIKKFIEESNKTYFVGEISLKQEISAYFDSYSNKINLVFEEIKNTCALDEKTTSNISLFMMTNNLIVSEDYSDYVTNYKQKAQMIPNEPSTINMTRRLLKMNEAQVVKLIIEDVFI